jgi:hypothetical protein
LVHAAKILVEEGRYKVKGISYKVESKKAEAGFPKKIPHRLVRDPM